MMNDVVYWMKGCLLLVKGTVQLCGSGFHFETYWENSENNFKFTDFYDIIIEPAAPMGLEATDFDMTSVELQWEPPANVMEGDVTQYVIEYIDIRVSSITSKNAS